MCCSTFTHLCCSVLQRVAACCSVLRCAHVVASGLVLCWHRPKDLFLERERERERRRFFLGRFFLKERERHDSSTWGTWLTYMYMYMGFFFERDIFMICHTHTCNVNESRTTYNEMNETCRIRVWSHTYHFIQWVTNFIQWVTNYI